MGCQAECGVTMKMWDQCPILGWWSSCKSACCCYTLLMKRSTTLEMSPRLTPTSLSSKRKISIEKPN